MAAVGVRELKQNASAVLARVAAGETVDVTVRGRLVGRIVPTDASADPFAQLVSEGLATRPRGSLAALGAPPGKMDPTRTLSSVVESMRDDERA
ncbi:MAG: type II toxin-antitoxin system prevent-host-death family antitoxin [Actinobacteria bacterium]|nr:type II toxin-antitoxin system prevent-host-death family antitoxin [Actinomycetota bacterium]